MCFIKIGKIVNTHGIKGELRIKSTFDKKEVVFKKDFSLYIGEEYNKKDIVTYRKHKEFDMVTLAGYDNINQVLEFLQKNVYVKREDLHLKQEEYLLQDLIGLEIEEEGVLLGKVVSILDNGANILLYVEGEKNFYIPKVDAYIEKVFLSEGKIIVKNAKGLML